MAFTSYLLRAGAVSSNTGRPFVMEVDLSKPTNQTRIYKDSICWSDGQGVKDEPVSWIATESFICYSETTKLRNSLLFKVASSFFPDKAVHQKECKQLKSKTLPTLCVQAGKGRWGRAITEHAFSHQLRLRGLIFFNHEKFFLGSGATSNTRS